MTAVYRLQVACRPTGLGRLGRPRPQAWSRPWAGPTPVSGAGACRLAQRPLAVPGPPLARLSTQSASDRSAPDPDSRRPPARPTVIGPARARAAAMPDWRQAKARLLSLDGAAWSQRLTQKRAQRPCDMPTWSAEPAGGPAHRISLFRGDITHLGVDAIVNAANESLLGGGGVDGAIHRAAGDRLLAECRTLDGCPTGQAKITGGYHLPAKYVIHTVGPRGEKPQALASCYRESLQLMLTHQLRTIAFPCISTGIYGYPSERACPVALAEVRDFLLQNADRVDRVIFCLFLAQDIQVYEEQMAILFPAPANA